MKSGEQIARTAYEQLNAKDKALVLDWRERGHDWATSVLNSGVLSPAGRRLGPAEAARAEEAAQFEELLLAQRLRMMPSDEALQRRETAEHEAAHAIVAQSLGIEVQAAIVKADNDGGCLHARCAPFETAVISLAGELWIGTFRSLEFPRGATGCENDRRAAVDAVGSDMNWELGNAHRRSFEILKENRALVLALADRIDRDGDYLP